MPPRFKSSHPEHQIYEDFGPLRLFADGPVALNGTGTIVRELPANCRGVLAHMYVEPDAGGLDTLDVFVQTLFTCSGVAVWVDVIHFQQWLGNDGASHIYDKIAISLDEAFFEVGTVLAVDTQRNLIGEAWRCRWEAAGATAAFQFNIDILPL